MPPARHLSGTQAGALVTRRHAPHRSCTLAVAATAPGAGDDARIRAGATTTTTASPPRLVSDADLVRSLSGLASDPLPRAHAPPAEPRVCRCCAGTALTPCTACSGTGSLPPGGYRATNPVIMNKIVGTTWTAAERTLGRTHFRCADKRRAGKLLVAAEGSGEPPPPQQQQPAVTNNAWFVLMVSACDASIRLWVEARSLKDRARWTPGWVTVADVVARRAEDAEEVDDGGKAAKKKKKGVGPRSGAGCKACGGSGRVACRLCSRAGEVIEV